MTCMGYFGSCLALCGLDLKSNLEANPFQLFKGLLLNSKDLDPGRLINCGSSWAN